jgi:lysophospholipase L1-like esterase
LIRRLGSWLRDLWLMVGIATVALCVLEAGLTLFFYVDDTLTFKPPDTRFKADTYDNAPWVYDYYVEHAEASVTTDWTPYVYWRRNPYHGRMINVDEHGIRKTTPTATGPDALKIFMFGGSTMWGTGARDEFTIPSLVAKELQQKGVVADVTNFGEGGYVSSQSLATLEQELRRGHIPDVVVLYDGINDVYSAYQQHVAGWPQNEGNRFRDFNLSLGQRAQSVLNDSARKLSTRRFLGHFWPFTRMPAFGQSQGGSAPVAFRLAPVSDDELARRSVDMFMTNVEIIRALGNHYGFESLSYWQPTILDKPHLTEYEKTYRLEMTPMEPFFRKAYGIVRQRHGSHLESLRDISQIFDETTVPVFVDYFHLGEVGDEMVAKAIAPDVMRKLVRRNGVRTGESGQATQ